MPERTIDLERDELLTLAQACRLLPRKPSPATLWRWRKTGILFNGQRIQLECVRVGGVWYTTAKAFADFLRRQTEAASSQNSDEPHERSEQTQRKLTEVGLLRG